VPALLNAGAINSDAAVVGLQARHILHGELAPRLWGTEYQASLDSVLVALSFVVLGIRPVAVFAVPFVGLLLMVTLAWDVLRRRLDAHRAALLVMPLVFAPMASNLPMVYVMRQTLATCLTLAVWLVETSARASRPRLRLGLAAVLFVTSLYIDTFAIVVLPAAGFFWLISAFDLRRLVEVWIVRVGVVLGVLVVPVVFFANPLPRLLFNARLLVETCLPFALGLRVFIKGQELHAAPWHAPLPFLLVQIAGSLAFVAAFVVSGWRVRRNLGSAGEWPITRLGLFGLGVACATIPAFLASTKPGDMWSSRYLAPIFWTAPFALAPAVAWLGHRRFAFFQAPYWVTALVGGWLSYGLFVDGPLPRVDARAAAVEERLLEDELLRANVHQAEAHYWLAYRLTFLFEEDPVVVPLEPLHDRYPPYRRAVEAAGRRALLFHPSEPRALPETSEAELQASGHPYERRDVAGFTILLLDR
jgi:hypothetical protein